MRAIAVCEIHTLVQQARRGNGFPIDVSVYGVRGLGGNIGDLTGSKWRMDWDEPEDDTLVYRGGSFFFVEKDIHSASRISQHPNNRHASIGFRLARSFNDAE